MATYPAPNAGLDCDSPGTAGCGFPVNAAIELRFDRYLAHETAVRQSISLYTGRPENQIFLQPEYDVVERVVRYQPRGPLAANVLYTVDITPPKKDSPFGFRAFDGAPLAPGPVPLSFSFYTSDEVLPDPPPCQPSCSTIADRFQQGGCASNGCHSTREDPDACAPGRALDHNGECVGVPRMGLVLQSPGEIALSAIQRVAHETETGASGGVSLVNPVRMGVQMPLIDPQRPGNSYLLYKVLLRPANFHSLPDDQLSPEDRARRAACTPVYRSLRPGDQPREASAEERERLREWFVRGQGMPLVSRTGDQGTSPVTFDWLHELQAFIAAGAVCP